jgi:putative spermidine/putrescine transport system permease protein
MSLPRTLRSRARTAGGRLLLAPGLFLLAAVFYFPLVYILPQSLPGFGEALANSVYIKVALTTVRVAIESTAITLVVGYPFAWLIARSSGTRRAILSGIVFIPFLTSMLVRTFSWVVVLGQDGVVNGALRALGIIHSPLSLLFTEGAVVSAIVQVSIPLMIFPLVSVMARVDSRLIMVAQSLGSRRFVAFLKVLVPLTSPGIRSGVTIVLLFSLASFASPALLGSSSQTMLGQLIQSEISNGADYSLAAALSVMLAVTGIVLVLIVNLLLRLVDRRWTRPRRRRDQLASGGAVGRLRLSAPLKRRPGRSMSPLVGRVVNLGLVAGFVVVVALFVLIPLIVMVPLSFTSGDVIKFPIPGYSMQWYQQVFNGGSGSDWVGAAAASARIAIGAGIAATTVATLSTLGFGRSHGRVRGAIEAAIVAPLIVPTVVYALGAYLAFSPLQLVDTEPGLVIAEAVLALPIAYLVISASHAGVGVHLERAAASLGSTPWRVVRRVVLPLIFPGVAVAVVLTVLSAFDESVVSIFLTGVNVQTVQSLIWGSVHLSLSPIVAAVSVLVIAVTAIVLAIVLGIAAIRGRAGSTFRNLMPGQ